MTKKAFVVAMALAAGGYATYRWTADDARPAPTHASDSLLQDRLWIDHIPRNDRDPVEIFVALKQDAIGGFHRGSQWTGQYEMFRYEKTGGEIRAVFPQSGSRESIKVKVTECDGDWMDYCLELSGNSRGARRYYSREDWVIGSIPDARQLAALLK